MYICWCYVFEISYFWGELFKQLAGGPVGEVIVTVLPHGLLLVNIQMSNHRDLYRCHWFF